MIYPDADKLESWGSKYALVTLAAKRAKQIKSGAPSLVETESRNPLTIALEEIAAGAIKCEVPDYDKVLSSSAEPEVAGLLSLTSDVEEEEHDTEAEAVASSVGDNELDLELEEEEEEEDEEEEADVWKAVLEDSDEDEAEHPAEEADAEIDAIDAAPRGKRGAAVDEDEEPAVDVEAEEDADLEASEDEEEPEEE